MPATTITTKGQVTIPKAIRDTMGVGPGDRVLIYRADDGRIVVEAETVDIRTLKGMVKPSRRGVTVEEMNEAVVRAAAERYLEETST